MADKTFDEVMNDYEDHQKDYRDALLSNNIEKMNEAELNISDDMYELSKWLNNELNKNDS